MQPISECDALCESALFDILDKFLYVSWLLLYFNTSIPFAFVSSLFIDTSCGDIIFSSLAECRCYPSANIQGA